MMYRILCLDGGGAWALIEVRALIDLYGAGTQGHVVLRDFDLVAANSGGSLVLAGLIENLTLAQILALFEDEANRRALFSPTTSVGDDALRSLAGIGPKYSTLAKLPAIERLVPNTGDTPLAQVMAGIIGPRGAAVHALIIGFDYDRNDAVFFRSAAAGSDAWGVGAPAVISLAGCVHASTNAPVNYFDAPAQVVGDPDRFWDGGITGHNNPTLAACIEALTMDVAPADLRVLSLGTGTVRLPLADAGAPATAFTQARGASSVIADLRKLATAILDDPPDFATFAAHALTGGRAGLPDGVPSRVVRMNPLISPVPPGPGGGAPPGWTAAQFQYLCALDMDAVEQSQVQYIDDWCTLWLRGGARNQPIRMDWQTMQALIGADSYAGARANWIALIGGAPGGPADS